jgi:hypothetical protein
MQDRRETRREREAREYRERQAAKRAASPTPMRKPRARRKREDALYRHAKLVYDFDRDFGGEFSLD